MTELVVYGGRILEVRVSGPSDGLPVMFHHGTPGTLPTRGLERAVHDRGLRLITFSRPGYANSTRLPGRAVADTVADCAAVLRMVGADRFYLAGWSGGGPHALACAALVPGAVRTLVIAGLAPYPGTDLDFTAGMSPDDLAEWNAAVQGEAQLRAHVATAAAVLTGEPADDRGADGQHQLPPADAMALTGEFAADLSAANRDALHPGIDGWVDDELAFVKPWGFDLGQVDTPVSIWHGSDDRSVPFTHGRWLAAHLRDASLHRAAGDGHLSVFAQRLDQMLDGLLAPQ
ncbi:alpha/beta fold hydrolase [uncultured Jatrophihabitans sp.]|uniref:alpha/beta fold hydrolase n=1 Tax=uncultured Jatrophihabitans sp. TaxID=1610747 RepID=UPI0035CB82D3